MLRYLLVFDASVVIGSWAKCRVCWILVIVAVAYSVGCSHASLVCCWGVFGEGCV